MNVNDQPDQQHDNDESSIEILSEGGDSHRRDSQWSLYSASRGNIAESDVSAMDFQKMSIHSKMATILHNDGRQFIERRDLDDGGLPYSAEFYLGDELWKLSGEDCFLMSPRRYIAKVAVEGTFDLDEAVDFAEAVRMLLKHLKVVKVLLDEHLEECNKAKSVLKSVLDELVNGSGENIDYKHDVMLLRILLQKHGNSLNLNFKHDLQNCSRRMSTLESYVTKGLKLIQRNDILGHTNDSTLSDEFINDAIQEALNAYRAQLAAVCPSTMLDKLNELPDDHILYVTTDDMHLFTDLTTPDQSLFDSVLSMIFSKFLARIREINDEQLADLNPLSNRIYLFVCKSLQEVVGQLGALIKNPNAITYSEEFGWKLTNVQEEPQTPYIQCLRQQLQMLAMLANHFEPGGLFITSNFPYEFKLFQNTDAIPEPVRIWLCLLDDCMMDLVQRDFDKMQMFSCFFKSYVSFVASEDFHGETMECLRRITHDALRSLTDMNSSIQHDRTSSHLDLLEYNKMISSCLDKFLCEHFENDCELIHATLRRIINQIMIKNVTFEESIELFHVIKKLLKDITELSLEWYLQIPPSENRDLLLRGQFVIPVDNRWKDTENECLKVVDPAGFVKMFKVLYSSEEIPKHYQLKVIQVLLDKLAAKQEETLRQDQHHLGVISYMINSFRNSILHLNRQPDYSCFEDFMQKIDESFSQAIKKRRSLEAFDSRLSTMKDSEATDPLHTDPFDTLPDFLAGSVPKELLANGLRIYTTQFNKHITKTVQLSREKRIEQIVSDVVHKVEPQLATTWTEEFKRNELPKVLAGLGAVWSLIVSKNHCSLEMLKKPSNLQISCILCYFGDLNHSDDDLYRLLYVSNQQGKELVLGLIAALLALYGHKVMIACLNSTLARRNSVDLMELFKVFSINHSISFGSMEDMAREQSREVYEKYAAYIYECIGVALNASNRPEHTSDEDGRSVLLIDDINILLHCNVLGKPFRRFVSPTIPGLDLLQEKAFFAKEQSTDSEDNQILMQILNSDDQQISELRAFLQRPQSYTVLESPSFDEKEFTNKTLVDRHFNFLRSYSHAHTNDDLRLSSNGVTTIKNLDGYGVHDTDNEFNYFSLKKSDFQQTVEGYKNYGYLRLGYIPFPYAHLLKSYPLVLGFVGAPLNGYDELTLNHHYGIYHTIAKSNPFSTMPTEFDYKEDFKQKNASDWPFALMVSINAAIDRNCSVLVFFEDEVEMEKFQNEVALHLTRLSVTAIRTGSNGENLSEDEIAVDEVTVLAIEALERNKDRSKHRQVHVIQSFWSSDSKEEELIRRQAERSYGSGSYELIYRNSAGSEPNPYDKYDSRYEWHSKHRANQAHYQCKKQHQNLTKLMEDYGKIKMFCENI